jgi:hypothetical protein
VTQGSVLDVYPCSLVTQDRGTGGGRRPAVSGVTTMHWRETSQTVTIKSVSLAFTHTYCHSFLDMLFTSRFLEQLTHPVISGALPVVHRPAICACDHSESATSHSLFEARLPYSLVYVIPHVPPPQSGSPGQADFRRTVRVDTGQASYIHT